MHILLFNRFDPMNPRAGGAEHWGDELLSRLAKEGHKATWFSTKFGNSKTNEIYKGINIQRQGNTITSIWHAYKFYRKNQNDIDIVIDEIHGIPFFTPLYVNKNKRIVLIHEVAGIIWFYVKSFPLAIIGYCLEKIYLRLLYSDTKIITVSESTKNNLIKYGLKNETIEVLPQGISS